VRLLFEAAEYFEQNMVIGIDRLAGEPSASRPISRRAAINGVDDHEFNAGVDDCPN